MGEIGDDMGSIFANVRDAALTLQQGGGIGHDFSTIRPKGAPVRGVGADASGPVSFMNVWDSMCRTIMSAGARRGAMMGTLRCDHPDIEAFIEAKADPALLRNFNLSVLVTDALPGCRPKRCGWPLMFGGKIYRTVSARGLWHKMMRSAYDYAEPGIIFIDRVNALNNLNYCETISSTNPCGEQPLPSFWRVSARLHQSSGAWWKSPSRPEPGSMRAGLTSLCQSQCAFSTISSTYRATRCPPRKRKRRQSAALGSA